MGQGIFRPFQASHWDMRRGKEVMMMKSGGKTARELKVFNVA